MTTAINLTEAIKDALAALNGSATFDEKHVVDETLVESTFLYLPTGYCLPAPTAADVTSPIPLPEYLQMRILYLNFRALILANIDRSKAIKIAAIRTGLVANGGYRIVEGNPGRTPYTYRNEIRFAALPDGVTIAPTMMKVGDEQPKDFNDDDAYAAIKAKRVVKFTDTRYVLENAYNDIMTLFATLNSEEVSRMVKYLPIMAHMAFTKFEHHYINNQYFQESYAKHFRALKLDGAAVTWNHADIIYPAVHWMGPHTMMVWSMNLLENDLMPRALSIKFPLIPAGTALISSSQAVINAASALPGFKFFFEAYEDQWSTVQEALARIKEKPYAYHTRSDLFGLPSLEATLADAKLAAAQLAPIAQAFINKYAQGTDLARIQAIKKHAEANLGLLRRFEMIFVGNAAQARLAAKTQSLQKLLSDVAEPAAVKVPKVTGVEEEESES